jgi:hypothetical protein
MWVKCDGRKVVDQMHLWEIVTIRFYGIWELFVDYVKSLENLWGFYGVLRFFGDYVIFGELS